MRIHVRSAGVLLLSAVSLHAQATGPRDFKVDDAWGRDVVEFRASAPMEEIVGTTNEIVGLVRIDPGAVRGPGTQARFDVDLTTIKTGIAMRDGSVMKSLGAGSQPKATFTLTRVKSSSADMMTPNATVNIVAQGTFSLHGVTKTIEVSAQITYIPRGGPFSQMRPGNFVRMVAAFDIKLADYQVDRSGPVLVLQVGETAHVTISALASDATPAEAETYRQSAIKYMGKARGGQQSPQ
jgi:polyisoprenoid-binding protein YceI